MGEQLCGVELPAGLNNNTTEANLYLVLNVILSIISKKIQQALVSGNEIKKGILFYYINYVMSKHCTSMPIEIS